MTAAAMQPSLQGNEQPIRRRGRGRPFVKGISGNPSGSNVSRRFTVLFDAIASEFGELTALEHEYIYRAAEQLRRAEREKSNAEHVRLTRCAAQLIDRVRDMRRDRKAAEPVGTAFDRYVAEKAAAR